VNPLIKQIPIAQPIQVGSYFEAVFTFLDDRHFVIPSVLSERTGEIVLNVYALCPQPGQQQAPAVIRSYVLTLPDAQIRTLRFFPDVSARGGASPGHFYADASKRVFGIQIEATSPSTKGEEEETVQELLVPVQALKAATRAPPYRRASVPYEPFLGRRLAYASRAAEGRLPAEKLPPALRDVGACQLRYAVCCGALLVFEVGWRRASSAKEKESIADFVGYSTLMGTRTYRGSYISSLSEAPSLAWCSVPYIECNAFGFFASRLHLSQLVEIL
jgi:hypothetical protein